MVVVVSHIRRTVLVANPKKMFYTVANLARSWFAEQGKEKKRESLAAHHPPDSSYREFAVKVQVCSTHSLRSVYLLRLCLYYTQSLKRPAEIRRTALCETNIHIHQYE